MLKWKRISQVPKHREEIKLDKIKSWQCKEERYKVAKGGWLSRVL